MFHRYKVLFLVLFIFISFIVVLSGGSCNEKEIDYYSRIWVNNANVYPGEDIKLQYRLEISQIKKRINIPYQIRIYRVDAEGIENAAQQEEAGLEQTDEKANRDFMKKAYKTFNLKQWFYPDENHWINVEKEQVLKGLPPGYYYVFIEFGDSKTSARFHISRIGAVSKAVGDQAVILVQDKKTSEPVGNALVKMKSKQGYMKIGKTDANGILRKNTGVLFEKRGYGGTLDLLIEKDDSIVVFEAYTHTGERKEFKGYIFTDRPIYRPGQKVYIKGILRNLEDNQLSPVMNETVKVTVNSPKGDKILEKEIVSDEFGAFSDSLNLGEEPPLGRYSIYVNWENQNQYGYFDVEEYRKPEYEIVVNTEKEHYLQGQPVTFNINAKYYFGGAVSNTKFNYEILRSNYHYHTPGYWWSKRSRPYYNTYNETVKQGEGITDKDGNAKVEIITEDSQNNYNYRIVVRMVDESRREVTGGASVVITTGTFFIDLQAGRYFYSPADKVRMKVITKDYQQKPVSKSVKMEVTRRLWNNDKREYESSQLLAETVETGKNGVGYLEFIPDKPGEFVVNARAIDEYENKVTSATNFYAFESGGYNWYNASAIEIKADRDFYNYGDTVRLMVTNPYNSGKALLQIEGDKIYDSKMIELDNSVIVYEFEAKQEYAPNVFATLSYWKDGKFNSTSETVVIPAKDKFVNLKIKTDREKYKPRQTGTYKLQTVKEDGTPVSCQITLGVSDESLFAVKEDETPNIQKYFYGNRYNKVQTSSSQIHAYYHGYEEDVTDEAAPAGTPPPAPMEKREKSMAAEPNLQQPDFVREFFPDTCYFNSNIITDHRGMAEVQVKFPDTLTTWRATARGVSKKTEVGQNNYKVIVTKDLLIRLITPRFLVEKDRAVISGIVHNYTDKNLTVQLSLESEQVSLNSDTNRKVEVPAQGKARIDWEIVSPVPGEARFLVKALTTEESDAVSLKIPIHPYGVEELVADAGSSEDEIELTASFPEDINRNSTSMTVNISPSLAGTLMGALEYLAQYTYGCTEQTLSRFIPNAVVQKALREFGVKNEKLQKELPKMMEKGLVRLYDYQHSDGGWGWWKNDESHPFMTAYAVYGLSLAKKSNYDIKESVINDGVNWLLNNYKKDMELKTKAYILFALSEAQVYEKEKMAEVFKKREKLDNYSKAILAIALHRSEMFEESGTLIKELEKSAQLGSTLAYWKGQGKYSWTDNPVETTSFVIQAFLEIDRNNPLVEKGVRYLAVSRRGNRWNSTKDTAMAVLAILEYVKQTGEMTPEFTATLWFNNNTIGEYNMTKKNISSGGVNVKIPVDMIRTGENKIRIAKIGPGRVYGSYALSYFSPENLEKSMNNGIKVTRKYYLVQPLDTREKAMNKTDLEKQYNVVVRGEDKLVPLKDVTKIELKPQDIIEVELSVESAGGNEYVMIEDFKPAGCEAVKEESEYWNWWYSHREYRDEKVAFFATDFPGGEQTFRYRLRAETPGRFTVLPARAELMYFPDLGGRSAEAHFTIKEK